MTLEERIARLIDPEAWWLLDQHPVPLGALTGHDLMCWCPLVDAEGKRVPCHADVLLELANGGVV